MRKADVLKRTSSSWKRQSFSKKFPDSQLADIHIPTSIKTIEDLIEYCLATYNGFAVSEEHKSEMPKKFFLEYLPLLKQRGVEIIFMELFLEEQQKELDDFFKSGKLLPALEECILVRDGSRGLENYTADTVSWSKLVLMKITTSCRKG